MLKLKNSSSQYDSLIPQVKPLDRWRTSQESNSLNLEKESANPKVAQLWPLFKTKRMDYNKEKIIVYLIVKANSGLRKFLTMALKINISKSYSCRVVLRITSQWHRLSIAFNLILTGKTSIELDRQLCSSKSRWKSL